MNILKEFKYYLNYNDKLTIKTYNKIKEYIEKYKIKIKEVDDYLNINSVLRTFRKLKVFV